MKERCKDWHKNIKMLIPMKTDKRLPIVFDKVIVFVKLYDLEL